MSWDSDAALALSSMGRNDSISDLESISNGDSDDQFIALSNLLFQLPNLQDLYLETSLTRYQVECLTRDLILPQLKILRIHILTCFG